MEYARRRMRAVSRFIKSVKETTYQCNVLKDMGTKGDTDSGAPASFKAKCATCLKGPNLFKTVVILACLAVVIQQVTVCVKKLINIPVATYTHFDFNNTLIYPSVTFCREPAYKYDKLLEYGLYAHPRFTNTWQNFDFDKYTLEELWTDITYNESDFFLQYGLNGQAENVAIEPSRGFVQGTCFTLQPKIEAYTASRESGYSITLKHSLDDIATSTSIYPPGYHVYIHYKKEPYTEVEVLTSGLVDYLYVNTGEELDIKFTVDEYVKISDAYDPCTYRHNYSANVCTTLQVWDQVSKLSGCSGPWMTSSGPPCVNYTQIRTLITNYINIYRDHNNTECLRFCRSLLYNAFVTNRQSEYWWDSATRQWQKRIGEATLQTQLYMHFNSMMVSVYQEYHNYDWNIFLSDLGGSIGFLLGLSVVGLLKIIEKIWASILGPSLKSFTLKSKKGSEADAVVAKTDGKDFIINKCNEWNTKNDLLNTNTEG